MTKGRFLARFNGDCRRHWPGILKRFDQYLASKSSVAADRPRFANAIRFSYMAGFDFYIFAQIFEVGAPEGGAPAGRRLIFALKRASESGLHRVWVYSPRDLAHLFGEYNRLARRYGLVECQVAGAHLPSAP